MISACLLGEAVRYDGGDCLHHFDGQAKIWIQTWQAQGLLLPLCPEVAGGLAVPRPAAEIQSGFEPVRVQTANGRDVTAAFHWGAEKALRQCQKFGIKLAILKQGSPSCGNSLIHDGSFLNQKITGQGITTRLLQAHGIEVFNESQLDAVQHHVVMRDDA